MRLRSGFTLVEVLVALTLLAGSLLALAHVVDAAARAARASQATSIATAAAAQKLEQLRALAWGMDLEGNAIEDFETDPARWPEAPASGVGLTPSSCASLAANTPGSVDYLDRSGAWVGEGSGPPARAAFTRRWCVEPPAASSPSTLVLHVAVLHRVATVRTEADPWVRVVQLDSARSRRTE